MKHKYILSLFDRNALKRIRDLITKHVEIMEILNKDSEKSAEGGAAMSYEIKIEFEEKWA